MMMMNTDSNKRVIRIVSGQLCEVSLDDPNIADTHAYMYLDEDKICLELLPDKSALLNGNEVTGQYWLQENDKIVIGNKILNLCRIRQWLEGQKDYDALQPFVKYGSPEDMSDAVVIRHNWWTILIVVFIILAVSAVVGLRFVKYQRMREEQMKELQLIQDSLMKSRIKIDSLYESLKQVEQE